MEVTMRTRSFAIALLLPVLLLAACGRLNDDGDTGSSGSTGATGSSGDTGSSGGIDHPTAADELVLRVQTGGGFVPVEYNLRSVPGFSLFGDGTLIVEGPMIEIYPPPALPNLQASRLTEEAVQVILEEAERAGLLGPDATYDYPCIADAPTTTFTIVVDGATHTISAYALGFDEGSGSGTCDGVDSEARAALSEFWAMLGDLSSWLPAGSMSTEQEYVPTEMRVYVRPYLGDAELVQEPIDWPLDTPLSSFGEPDANLTDTRCAVVSGADLEELLPLAQTANQLTPWMSDGTEHALVFRPLLPDEHTC
jgi:hypothetical protein